MSKIFKNLKSGLIEEVFNEEVIAQCEKHPEAWEEVKKASKEDKPEEEKQNKKQK